jgi:hypothetical protein
MVEASCLSFDEPHQSGSALPELYMKSQSPFRAQAAAARVFHSSRHFVEAGVFHFKPRCKAEALAPPVLHFNHHANEQTLAPGVFHPGRRDLAPMFFHTVDLVSDTLLCLIAASAK